MKRLLITLMIVGMSVLSLSAAQTTIPTLQRVDTKQKVVGAKVSGAKAATQSSFAVGSGSAGSTGGQQFGQVPGVSPLDELFPIKYAYPGTNVATDLVALDIHSHIGNGVCTGTRFHKRWFITAAHCFDGLFDTNVNPRIVFGAKQLANGVWQVSIAEPHTDEPTNGTLYFYRNGYSSSEENAFAHAEDIAIIGLDKEDKIISLLNKNLKEFDKTAVQIQGVSALLAKTPAAAHTEQVTSAQKSTRKKMVNAISDTKRFLRLPLNGFHFMTFSAESARLEMSGIPFVRNTRKAYGCWFQYELDANKVVINRKLPVKYWFTYVDVPKDNRVIQWMGVEPEGMSGTPFIINGYIVGVGSGEGQTPLFTDEFTAFLQKYMGADYQQGLCVRSVVANEEAITQRNDDATAIHAAS